MYFIYSSVLTFLEKMFFILCCVPAFFIKFYFVLLPPCCGPAVHKNIQLKGKRVDVKKALSKNEIQMQQRNRMGGMGGMGRGGGNGPWAGNRNDSWGNNQGGGWQGRGCGVGRC